MICHLFSTELIPWRIIIHSQILYLSAKLSEISLKILIFFQILHASVAVFDLPSKQIIIKLTTMTPKTHLMNEEFIIS